MPAAKKAQAVAAKKTATKTTTKVVKPKGSAGAASPALAAVSAAASPALAAATAAAIQVNLAGTTETPVTVETSTSTTEQTGRAFLDELAKLLVGRRHSIDESSDEEGATQGLRLLRIAELAKGDLRGIPRDVRALFVERAVLRHSPVLFHFGTQPLREFVLAPQVVFSSGSPEEIARFSCLASLRLFRGRISALSLLARDNPVRTGFILDDLLLEVLVELYAIWKSMESRSGGAAFRGFNATVALHTLDRESLARFSSAAELSGRDGSSVVSLVAAARPAALPAVAVPEPRRAAAAPFSPPRRDRCAFCGFAGHTVEVCRKRLALPPLAPAAPAGGSMKQEKREGA